MRYIFIVFVFLYSLMSLSANHQVEEFSLEVIGSQVREEIVKFSNGRKFISFRHEGGFKTSIAKYGTYFCVGNMFYNKENYLENMNYICQFSDQNNDKFWSKGKRLEGSEMDLAVGKYRIIDAEGFWKDFLGVECTYGLEYVNKIIFSPGRCR